MIAIVDYGAGNLFSVKNALDYLMLPSVITKEVSEIRSADKLILPGVGAFPDAMEMLDRSGLRDVLLEEAEKKPFLGICLGMQMLFDRSFEFGETKGLGLLPGDVVPIEAPGQKIPHMGWSPLYLKNRCEIAGDTESGDMVYFVHSYKVVTEDPLISMYTEYGGEIPAIVFRDKIYGTQFHPEKSGSVGLAMLKRFGGMK
ncbi:MAG: imidazole glycerol phosphate synthase subunit HisH [Firmicutes bacterium HGW-Firmicutes-11]|jgi:glutamine amidotransferase|nr:MAG: imidazole glycerol phosphate synthase subunit HisH [Firmicutes bacterium HGW-Firmicutes-11]